MRSPRALSELGLANDDRASGLQPRHDCRRRIWIDMGREEPTGARLRAGHRAEILHRQRHTMQRTKPLTARTPRIRIARFFKGCISANLREGMKARLESP